MLRQMNVVTGRRIGDDYAVACMMIRKMYFLLSNL